MRQEHVVYEVVTMEFSSCDDWLDNVALLRMHNTAFVSSALACCSSLSTMLDGQLQGQWTAAGHDPAATQR